MRDLGPDIIIFTGAIVLVAYGSLVIATQAAIKNDINSLVGSPEKVANQQKQTLIDGTVSNINSFGTDIQNYITYSHNGAIASVVIGVLQMVALIFKHSVRPSYYLGGRR